ncbi:hypothetical protein ALO56_05267 [Pseudomonas viridiflava]|uniref:Uncharacterized protein n=1 Tax=Pseudomonas syringae pv. ribicola TaxID=55398 RepID=A0A0N8SQY2_PSESI|nr:Uncharacterized protein ALO47_05300 [Pseudomonas syringae pv. ribicola]KPZ27618.1 hypothetical protein ALO56_05267 [Pseudomonas viridiflava]
MKRPRSGEHPDRRPRVPGLDVLDHQAIEGLVIVLGNVADMRRRQHVAQRAERVVFRERLGIEHVQSGSGDSALLQGFDQRRFVDDRPARRIDDERAGLHPAQRFSIHEPSAALAEHQMHRQYIGLLEQRLLAHISDATFGGGLRCQILAPGDDLHAERLTVAGNPLADTAQPQNAQRLAVQIAAQPDLPVTGAQCIGFGHQIASDAHDQRPGQLRRCLLVAVGAAHRNIQPFGRCDVDGRIAHAAGGQQFQSRELAEQGGVEQGSFAHHADHIEVLEALDHGGSVGGEVMQEADLADGVQWRPVHHIAGHVLPVIKHSNGQSVHEQWSP